MNALKESKGRVGAIAFVFGLVVLFGRAVAADEERAPRVPYQPKLERNGDTLRDAVWGVEITVPGYEPWNDHPLLGRPNFLFAAHSSGTCGLQLSMFGEPFEQDGTPEQCRRRYAGNPEPIKKDKSARLYEEQASPVAFARFDQTTDSKGIHTVQNQLYGYWTRGDHCFELHVSTVDCPAEQFASQAMPILRSVTLSEDTGATVETVMAAMRVGGDPRDWRLHWLLAGQFLHPTNEKDTDLPRARRFYASAMSLALDRMSVVERWASEEGIGLAWLQENEGAKAIPYLERAVETAKQSPKLANFESEYNLMCARSLAGELDAACAMARDYLKSDPKELKARLKTIAKDKQLKALTKSECYRTLVRELDDET